MNIKQLRDKYDEIKSVNPHRDQSVKSMKSQTPSRQQREAAFGGSRKSIIQIGNTTKTLLCSPCFNRRQAEYRRLQRQRESLDQKHHVQDLVRYEETREYLQRNQELMVSMKRRQLEEQNLRESLIQKEKQKQEFLSEKQKDKEYERYIMLKNRELDELEKNMRLNKQKSLNRELQQQIEYKKINQREEKASFSEDPYWKYFSEEEHRQMQRKNQQVQYVEQNWNYHQQQKRKQSQLEQQALQQELQQRNQTLIDLSVKSKEKKQVKLNYQREYNNQLQLQMKVKQAQKETARLLELQQARQYDSMIQQRESERDRMEYQQRQRLTESLRYGLKSQSQQSKRPETPKGVYTNDIMRSQVSKKHIMCNDCQRPQEPQQLTELI
ncbi:hypothetical protein pb186bvf_013891 [Paramecium bursaria]